MIQILSETAGLYLHPMPERMLYVLVSEEPKLRFPADCPLFHTSELLGGCGIRMQPQCLPDAFRSFPHMVEW
jgi:hypothetical protein